jgi:hypothetical protein
MAGAATTGSTTAPSACPACLTSPARRACGGGESPALGVYDDYEAYLRIGSAGDYAKKFGIDKLTYTKSCSSIRPTTATGSNRRWIKSSPSVR